VIIRMPFFNLTRALDAGRKRPQPLQNCLLTRAGILTLIRVLIFRAICTYLSLRSGCRMCSSFANAKSSSMRSKAIFLEFCACFLYLTITRFNFKIKAYFTKNKDFDARKDFTEDRLRDGKIYPLENNRSQNCHHF
jgi:hypothetical protein